MASSCLCDLELCHWPSLSLSFLACKVGTVRRCRAKPGKAVHVNYLDAGVEGAASEHWLVLAAALRPRGCCRGSVLGQGVFLERRGSWGEPRRTGEHSWQGQRLSCGSEV